MSLLAKFNTPRSSVIVLFIAMKLSAKYAYRFFAPAFFFPTFCKPLLKRKMRMAQMSVGIRDFKDSTLSGCTVTSSSHFHRDIITVRKELNECIRR
jgi:hypothetical protein